MKHLILFMGHLAALKTTLSKQIAKDLDIVCLNKDDIKEVLTDAIGYETREDNLKLTKATFDVMMHTGRSMLNHHDRLILEANFKPHEIDIIIKTFDDVKIDGVFLTANQDVLYQRYLNRQPNRHIAHTSTGLITYETFMKITSTHDDYTHLMGYRIFDTTQMDDQVYQTIKKHIENVLTDS